MNHLSRLRTILVNDPVRWHALDLVRSLGLPGLWVGAGFVRNAVWDHLHDRPPAPPSTDIDVLWFESGHVEPADDHRLEATLRSLDPNLDWSVKNQARMHARNDDAPYGSVIEAVRNWPETATAIAVRRTRVDRCDIIAPFGLDDLFAPTLRPTPRFLAEKYQTYVDRVQAKRWLATWPRLRMATPTPVDIPPVNAPPVDAPPVNDGNRPPQPGPASVASLVSQASDPKAVAETGRRHVGFHSD